MAVVAAAAAVLALLPAIATAEGPAAAASTVTSTHPAYAASLEQCVTAPTDAERAVTFSAEMNAVPGTARMEARIDLAERAPAETRFRSVASPLLTWRSSSPGVRSFRFIRQFTNLSAPAGYRGSVRFRWLNAKGRIIKFAELATTVCHQPVNPAGSGHHTETTPAPAAG
jgi:hypothetical protein